MHRRAPEQVPVSLVTWHAVVASMALACGVQWHVPALGTQVGLRGFVVRALDAPCAVAGEDGWVAVLDGETLDGWQISDDGAWRVEEGAILGSGSRSHLFSPRGDYTDFEVLVEARINDNGNSGLYGRASFGPGWPAGYEAQINSSFPDPQKTGSIYALAPVLSEMIPPDMWFEQRLLIRETPEGTYLRTTLNGVVVSEHLDTQRLHATGHLALQQHHQGSEVRVRRMLVRQL